MPLSRPHGPMSATVTLQASATCPYNIPFSDAAGSSSSTGPLRRSAFAKMQAVSLLAVRNPCRASIGRHFARMSLSLMPRPASEPRPMPKSMTIGCDQTTVSKAPQGGKGDSLGHRLSFWSGFTRLVLDVHKGESTAPGRECEVFRTACWGREEGWPSG